MQSDIRKRAKEIFYANAGLFIVIGIAATAVSFLLNNGVDGVFSSITASFSSGHSGGVEPVLRRSRNGLIYSVLGTILSAAVNSCLCCFYMRAYNRGKPEVEDLKFVFELGEYTSTFFKILLEVFIIEAAFTVVAVLGIVFSVFVPFLPFVIIPLFFVALFVISITFKTVWYLFVTNPGYRTSYYIKAAFKITRGKRWDFFIFMIAVYFPAVMIGLLLSIPLFFISGIITFIADVYVQIYSGLAVAGYVNELIPDEWFAGTMVLD